MSDNWVVQNLQNALDTWNSKLAEIWQILTQSPETFKGGGIWQVIVQIHGALQAIGYALLVLFFVVGVVKTCGSFTEVKKTGTCIKNIYPFCDCKRRSHVWTGADDGIIQYHTRSDQYGYADRWIWKYGRYRFTGRNHRSGRRLWIF